MVQFQPMFELNEQFDVEAVTAYAAQLITAPTKITLKYCAKTITN